MTYPSLRARIKVEWKSYLVAALFTVIAEYIGTVKLKVGPGMIILFPVFYAIILGMLSGPQVMRWFGCSAPACFEYRWLSVKPCLLNNDPESSGSRLWIGGFPVIHRRC